MRTNTFAAGNFSEHEVQEQSEYARWCRDTILGFERYGDVICEAILGDLPPLDELASQRIAEARLLYRDWTAFWSRHEQWSQAHVRAGWTNVVGLDLDRGRTTRIAQLSLDGRTDVTNNSTWLDDAVAAVFRMDNLPVIFMPGNETEQAGTPRTLIVGDSADF